MTTIPAAPAPLRLSQVLKMITWAVRRDRRVVPHMTGVLRRAWRTVRSLRSRKRQMPGRRFVMIGLTERMGDVVAAEPVAQWARDTYPDAHIVWVTRAPFSAVASSFTGVDSVVTVGCITEWMLVWASGVAEVVWDLHLSSQICPVCSLPVPKTGVAARIGYDNYFDFGNLLAIRCLSAGLPPIEAGPVLLPGPEVRRAVDAFGLADRFVVIHCAPSEPDRDWSTEKWRQLVATLADQRGLCVVEIGLHPLAIPQDGPNRRDLCGTTMMEMAEIIRRATLFVGIDSGPAQMANAVGTPGVVLMGRYVRWDDHMPYTGGYEDGRLGRLVRVRGPLPELDSSTATEAVLQQLDRIPAA